MKLLYIIPVVFGLCACDFDQTEYVLDKTAFCNAVAPYEVECRDKDNNLVTGKVVRFYDNNVKAEELSVKNGKYDGVMKSWHTNGKLAAQATAKNGVVNGVSKEYYENGNLQIERTIKDNRETGLVKEYYPDGTLRIEYITNNGYLDGPYKEYYLNGKLKSEGIYKGGTFKNNYEEPQKYGLVKEYYEDGTLKGEYTYQEGKLNGPYKTYYRGGELKREGVYKDGSVVKHTIRGLAESKKMQDLIDSYAMSKEKSSKKDDKRIDAGTMLFKKDGVSISRVRAGSCYMHIENQGTKIYDADSCFGLNDGDWDVVFEDGIIAGTYKCANNQGEKNSLGTPNGDNGQYCWCGVRGIIIPSSGKVITAQDSELSDVFYFSYDTGSVSKCKQTCPIACSSDTREGISSIRDSIYGSLEKMTQSITDINAQYTVNDEDNSVEEMTDAMKDMAKGLTESMKIMVDGLKNMDNQ